MSVPVLRTPLARKVWRRLFGEDSWTRLAGDFREKEQAGLVRRPNYAYGMLRAADVARFFGKTQVTVCEFGVATGMGLTNMADLADLIGGETGIRFRVVGFDTGAGLPPPGGYKDHPELWSGGDFPMGDPEQLRARLKGRAELVLGNIDDTIDAFTKTLTPDCPLGFVSIDVDIYSGTVAALRGLGGPADCYLPAISFYLDDISSYFSNDACGELCAVHEHNAAHPLRLLDVDRSLPGRRDHPVASWYRSMYVCHILDHAARTRPRERGSLTLQDHLEFMAALR
ncbi:MAG: hypothetical protein ABI699_19340 [Caldimonas sp.]